MIRIAVEVFLILSVFGSGVNFQEYQEDKPGMALVSLVLAGATAYLLLAVAGGKL